MIVYAFSGTKLGPPPFYIETVDIISVDYNEATNQITAAKIFGGFPQTTYQSFDPDPNPAVPVASVQDDGNQVDFYFIKFYPFLTATVVTPPPPVIPTVPLLINSITVINEMPGLSGSATINASGGTAPLTYSINGVDYLNTNLFENLASGNYTGYVKDADGAITTQSFTILAAPPQPPIPPVNIIQDVIALADANIEIQNAYKRVVFKTVFGKVPSIIYNGDFKVYDGQNWAFWVKYGGINVTRAQRTTVDANGAIIPIDNYAIKFNEKAIANKYLEHSTIPVQSGDTLKISYSVGKTIGTGQYRQNYTIFLGSDPYGAPALVSVYYECKIRIKVGNYYLYNEKEGNSFVWVNQLATVIHNIYNSDGDLNSFKINFNIPECPVSGPMIIELFGFQKVKYTVTDEFKATPFITIPQQFIREELNEYDPILFDDLTASKTSQSANNDVDGILNISDNLKFYTEKPDVFDILFGDYFYRRGFDQLLDNLYAIKVGDNYSSEWYEFGTSTKPVPFGMAESRAVLKAYQSPFRFWEGELRLTPFADTFNYLNIFLFNVIGQPSFNRKQFIVLGGDIDLKHNTFSNVRLAEIFDRVPKSNDNSLPDYPDSGLPDFIQDPNANTNNGIFTEEFTEEFS